MGSSRLQSVARVQHCRTTLKSIAHEAFSWTLLCYTLEKSRSTGPPRPYPLDGAPDLRSLFLRILGIPGTLRHSAPRAVTPLGLESACLLACFFFFFFLPKAFGRIWARPLPFPCPLQRDGERAGSTSWALLSPGKLGGCRKIGVSMMFSSLSPMYSRNRAPAVKPGPDV